MLKAQRRVNAVQNVCELAQRIERKVERLDFAVSFYGMYLTHDLLRFRRAELRFNTEHYTRLDVTFKDYFRPLLYADSIFS